MRDAFSRRWLSCGSLKCAVVLHYAVRAAAQGPTAEVCDTSDKVGQACAEAELERREILDAAAVHVELLQRGRIHERVRRPQPETVRLTGYNGSAVVAAQAEGGSGIPQCATYGCSDDYEPLQSCQCNRKCQKYWNCCSDYLWSCVWFPKRTEAPTPAPTLPPPTPMPTPSEHTHSGPAPLLEFYMYRAQGDDSYTLENVNAANAAGVMWYLHNEVVASCPRKFGVTRILRLKVKVQATEALFARGMNFGVRYAFDSGKCTGPGDCAKTWDNYGYVVGCNKFESKYPYPDRDTFYPGGVWYSLPGPCPSQDYKHQSDSCKRAQPGGRCAFPTGDWTCTWSYEDAGEISVDEMVGIRGSHQAWCRRGCREYYRGSDRGVCTSFWNGKYSVDKNRERTAKMVDMFKRKYPDSPELSEPPCDFDKSMYVNLG